MYGLKCLTAQDLLQQSCYQNLDSQIYHPISKILLGQESKDNVCLKLLNLNFWSFILSSFEVKLFVGQKS